MATPTDTDVPAAVPDETGWPGNLKPSWTTAGRETWAPDPPGQNRDLQFPTSVRTYEQMRADGQVASVIAACTLPILRAPWNLEGDVRPEVEQLVRTCLGLPRPGQALPKRPRHAAGIVWSQHVREALLCLTYGFVPFEQVAVISRPGDPGHPDWATSRPVVMLKKLALRLPSTLTHDGVRIGRDGGLIGITQQGPGGGAAGFGAANPAGDILIPADRLVMYTTGKEGGNWYGRSMLRTAYKDWYLKDKAERINLQTLDRNGMGIPVVTYDESTGTTREEALQVASEIRSGATAGAAITPNMDIRLRGVEGSTVDALPTIKHHNEAISRSVLAMFLDLGHDNGARALGETFLSMFTTSLQSVADDLAVTATEHVVRDLVEWNWGPDEPYPDLTAGQITADQALTPDGLKMLTNAGLLTPDSDLEAHVRDRYRLPAQPDATIDVDGAGEEAAPAGVDPSMTAAMGAYERHLSARLAHLAR